MNNTHSDTYLINRPVVFLPGTLCDERVFLPCWQYLDIPQQAYVPLQWADTISQMLALAQDRLDYFAEPVHLVGFSMGAYIAALTALGAPQKVASLTVIGSSCQALPDTELTQRKNLLNAIRQAKFKGMSDKHIATMLHADNVSNPALFDVIRAMEQDLGLPVLASQLTATSERKNLLAELAQSGVTLNFIAGEHDHLVSPAQLSAAQQHVAGSTLNIVAKAGHMVPLEQPQRLAAILHSLLENA